MWMPRLACPECAVEIDASAVVCRCERCGIHYARANGMWRLLTPARTTALEPFIQQYRIVRERDGHRSIDPDDYAALPCVAPNHPHAAEWAIRRETYGHLLRHVRSAEHEYMRTLDLGAGSALIS